MKGMKYIRIQFLLIAIQLLLFCSCINSVSAQNTEPGKRWNFLTEVYMLFPNMEGETGVGNTITVPVNANTGDIFNILKLGGMIYLEAHTNKWAITSDFVFMNLEKEVTPTILIRNGSVGVDQYIWEAAGLYRINSFLEVGAGGRLNHLAAEVGGERNVFPGSSEEFSGYQSKTFYDPVLITRLSTDIKDKWLFQFRGDLGGLGVGSDFTWQVQAYGGYRFSKFFQLTAGYRILDINYDKGTNSQRFIFNMSEFGPVIRAGFTF
jgi:hypothetical protein